MQWKAATVIFSLSCQSSLYVWDTYFKDNKHTMAPIPLTFIPSRAISHPNNLKERTTFLQFLWCMHKITDFWMDSQVNSDPWPTTHCKDTQWQKTAPVMTAGAKRKFAINLLLIASLVSVMPMPNLVLVYSGNK